MKRTGGLLVLAAVCTMAACQIVAGIQDRVLFTADDAATGTADGAATGSSSGSSSMMGTPGSEGSASDDERNDFLSGEVFEPLKRPFERRYRQVGLGIHRRPP